MAEFTIEVMDNRAVYTGSDFYSGEDTVHFDFQGEWANAANKNAIFEAYNRVMVEIDSDGNCAVPAFTNPGKIEVYVVADGLMTASPAVIREKAEQPSAGDSGGGALLLVVTDNDDGTYNSNYDFATVLAAIENDTGVFGVFSYDNKCGPIGEIRLSDGAIMLKDIAVGPPSLSWMEDTGISGIE